MLALLAVGACEVGPDYFRPAAPVPTEYKEIKGWKPATPRAAGSDQAWWSIYKDTVLDGLERQIDISNQNLKASEAAYRQAVAIVAEARSALYPTLALGAGATRSGPLAPSHSSILVSGGTGSPTTVLTSGRGTQNQFNIGLTASWEPDIWGQIRRTIESDVAAAQASAAELAAARLSAQAQLATDYFELRATDEQKRLLDKAVVAYTESLRITKNQFAVGVAAQSDVITAQTQVEQTQAQAVNLGVARGQYEHAIAVLVGKPPAELAIALAAPLANQVPVVPPGIPSALLERRPDIAAAEREMQSANAQIGVAVAAYYPTITLSATLGPTSTALNTLFTAASTLWSAGAQASETLLDFGLRDAQVAQANAIYDQNVANYRQTVLTAFQQVEDELVALRVLADQERIENAAVKDAQLAEKLMLNRYLAGNVPYTNVVVAQATALSNEESAVTILENRLVASVALVAAVGGGWSAAQLPSP